ncbi:MAG: hypothetical protein M3252_02160 [Actinomycetota bacterium]|nr:hypothetical protein [Actinomycetota bacterium]
MERSIWDGFDAVIRDPDSRPLDVLRVVGVYQRYLDAVEREAVKAARRTGSTWHEIATAIGGTKQSAWQRLRHLEQAVRETETGAEPQELLTGVLRLSLPKPPYPPLPG